MSFTPLKILRSIFPPCSSGYNQAKKSSTVSYIMQFNTNNLSHYGDILAIPLFILLSVYFYKIEHKSPLEYVLFGFALAGFVLDTLYTYLYLTQRKRQ